MKYSIFVSRDKSGMGFPNAHLLIKRAARTALKAEGVDVPSSIDVLLTDDSGIHGINLEYRNVDKPTDVLSFPQSDFIPSEFNAAIAEKNLETGELMLGDIVISLERTKVQGEEYGHGEKREIMYLTVHSVLHLLGYDHVDEAEMKKQMRAREKAIMKLLDENA